MSESGESSRPRPRWRSCLVFVAVSCVLTLLLLEITLRLFMGHMLGPAETQGLVAAAPHGTVRLTANFRGEMTIAGRTCAVCTNSFGLRGAELGPRVEGERRVLVLGDSMTFGWGVEEEEAFPAQVQGLLDRPERRVTIMNAAVPGYGTREMVYAFERLDDALAPDSVVACVYVGNDFEDDVWVDKVVVNGFPMEAHVARAVDGTWRGWLSIRMRSWLLMERLWQRASPDSNLWTAIAADSEPADERLRQYAGWPPIGQRMDCLFVDRQPPGAAVRRAFERMGAAFDDLRTRAGDRPVLIVIVPTLWHCVPGALYDARLSELGLDPTAHRRGNAQAGVARLAKERGLHYVDLTPALGAGPNPTLRFIPGDRHLTVQGNADAAACVAPVLEALLRR